MNSKQIFPIKKPERAIFNGESVGPAFGESELVAKDEPFNGEGLCKSIMTGTAYMTGKKGVSELTGIT